jgi:hypothetical protein
MAADFDVQEELGPSRVKSGEGLSSSSLAVRDDPGVGGGDETTHNLLLVVAARVRLAGTKADADGCSKDAQSDRNVVTVTTILPVPFRHDNTVDVGV